MDDYSSSTAVAQANIWLLESFCRRLNIDIEGRLKEKPDEESIWEYMTEEEWYPDFKRKIEKD